jgi:hypothetical protein
MVPYIAYSIFVHTSFEFIVDSRGQQYISMMIKISEGKGLYTVAYIAFFQLCAYISQNLEWIPGGSSTLA